MIRRELDLLKAMISVPSVSRSEDKVADLIFQELTDRGMSPRRFHNNVWAIAAPYDPSLPTLMLNSHCDTVGPVESWTRDPFAPVEEGGCLYGLGSNDAGGAVVSLIALFDDARFRTLPFNLVLAVTAQEEVMGPEGMRGFLPYLSEEYGIKIDMAIVGEPTEMQPAVGERGLVVLDAVSRGVSGHAARNEGVNAIYKAISDIQKLRDFHWPAVSQLLGDISLSVTMIEAGQRHNVVPDVCKWVVDVRTTDAYSNEQVVEMLRLSVDSELTPRSTRVRASAIADSHPLVRAALKCGLKPFVSPTTSDMALMGEIESMKIGPGVSSRSHSADEYILVDELRRAKVIYKELFDNLVDILK